MPNRRNIVLTRDRSFSFPGCEIAHSKEEALALCSDEAEVFIFGGEEIYNMFLSDVEKMYITKIEHVFEGDTFFPEVDFTEWEECSREKGIKDEANPYDYYFHVYERRNKNK